MTSTGEVEAPDNNSVATDQNKDPGKATKTDKMESFFDYYLYPNTTSPVLTVRISSSMKSDIEIRILDPAGKMVVTKPQTIEPGLTRLEIDMSTLPVGYYALSIYHDGKVMTRKVVVAK
jgi:hypothetical protein